MLIYISGDPPNTKKIDNDEPYGCGVATNRNSIPATLKSKASHNPLLYFSFLFTFSIFFPLCFLKILFEYTYSMNNLNFPQTRWSL